MPVQWNRREQQVAFKVIRSEEGLVRCYNGGEHAVGGFAPGADAAIADPIGGAVWSGGVPNV